MAEEPKSIRLNKAAKEFNVGIQSLVEFLAKKGHQVDVNPNTKISPEQYELLTQAFQSERQVKEQADKIEITPSSNTVVIEASKTIVENDTEDTPDEIIIKNVFSKPFSPEPKVEPEPVSEPEPAPTPEPEPAPAPEVEESPAPVQEVKEEAPALPADEHDETNSEIPTITGPRILDKIDLSAINTKVRPDKKPKSKKNDPKTSKPAESKKQPAPAPVVEKPKAVEPEPVAKAPEKVTEFIETQYTKLEGPKVTGKIDLSQFEKAKSETPSERKKRKRIKKEGVKIDEVASENNNKNKQQPNKNNAKPQQPKAKAKPVKKTEIDDNEIEQQIRDTLARLGTMGKSKTSKHNREKRQKVHQRIEEAQLNEMESQKTLQVTEFVTANELATMMNIPVTQIISTCMSVGIFVSINQRLDAETIKLIADEFGFEINFASADVVDELNKIEEEDRPEDLVAFKNIS